MLRFLLLLIVSLLRKKPRWCQWFYASNLFVFLWRFGDFFMTSSFHCLAASVKLLEHPILVIPLKRDQLMVGSFLRVSNVRFPTNEKL